MAPIRTVRIAIVGSGPSGFFTAAGLLALSEPLVLVDMYERLQTPWGLVRAGVAPDHPKIKSVSAVFDKTMAHDRFRYFGNVEIGRHVSREELLERYDAVVYATGAQTDRRLGIEGEHLRGSLPASHVVGWYNGHPEHRDHGPDLNTPRAVIVGNGNVALDIARILMTPADRLESTDIADHALAALRSSRVSEVVILGRRGPEQATFTSAELAELSTMTGARVVVDPPAVLDDDGRVEGKQDARIERNLAVLRNYRDQEPDPRTDSDRRIVLRFLASPLRAGGAGHIEHLEVGGNRLSSDETGTAVAIDTGERDVIETGLLISAVGYLGEPIQGLPVDPSTGTVPHLDGMVVGLQREFVVGWLKRGPSGVIGINKKCAADTVARLVRELGPPTSWGAGRELPEPDWLADRQPALITTAGWQAVDMAERADGARAGRPRVKRCSETELLYAAGVQTTVL
jgi:ferredoxin--NADP+ reductase